MKKIIDERGRLFGLISLIDIVVLAAVALLVVAFFMRANVQSPATIVYTEEVTYTVQVSMIRGSAMALMRPGDRLYNRENGAFMGRITNVSATGALSPERIIDGTFVLGEVEGRFDVTLTVEVEASVFNNRLFASRLTELNANANYQFATRYNHFNGFVTSITGGP